MRMKRGLFFALATLLLGATCFERSAFAQPAKPQAHETNVDGVTAEISEAVRKEGVLTVKMRFRNTGTGTSTVKVLADVRDSDRYYPVAGSTKFMVLKDSKGVPLMVQVGNNGTLNPEIKPGGSFLFWAKYPSPPADARKFTFFTPLTPPIEDVPITDAK